MTRAKRLLGLAGVLVIGAVLLAACGSNGDDTANGDNADANSSNDTSAVSTFEPGSGEYQTLSMDEFANIIENKSDEYQIIDVHIPYAGEVPNTDANIAYNDLGALMAAIPDKNTPVILYCRSGSMSEQASKALIARGYTQVWDVPGGMAAWQASGRDLIDQ